ncbi:DUF1758 domain-containing protein [Trichonephila inaurata madagascariensis]|uniref:DUF1758 domain-containing protein n=1 Tax=Trichonephila inaurata madagascariensis TaxID=2747483 RepID=A0A8X6WM58_9ARAC|nr:DUF1758 domain-containing protein [Trichonephila inaurata madagascariensis]GFY37522.1 DUF1758 domain-containing protein [Trichonephila inaurata madagascariensis]
MQNIDGNLQKFWGDRTEQRRSKALSRKEYCENHQMTHIRNKASRYVVQMPVKDIQGLGYRCFGGSLRSRSVHALCQRRWVPPQPKLIGESPNLLWKKVRLSLQVHLAKESSCTLIQPWQFAWINTPANQLKTFVGNQVSKIQTLTENYEWKHIPSAQNPADIISRGVNPEELSSLTLWWNGPQHLDIPEQFVLNLFNCSSDRLTCRNLKNSLISMTSIWTLTFENDLLNITK